MDKKRMTEYIKVNLPLTEQDYLAGNGEGVWVLVDPKTKQAHDTDATGGGYVGILDNDSCYYGGWTYTSQALNGMVFETPCGLLVQGWHFRNGYLSWQGVDWRPENDNPVVPCPRFMSEPCPLRHPLLQRERYDLHSDDVVYQCACHQTDRPYTFEGSLDEAHKQVWQESDELWKTFETAHNGRVCRHQSRYGRTSKAWTAYYSPMECARLWPACSYCSVLEKDLTPQKGNVFLALTQEAANGSLHMRMQQYKNERKSDPLFEHLGGTPAKRLAYYGKARADGKSLSRVVKLTVAEKSDYFLTADSGPGEENQTGLIVPRFGKNPEQHVSVILTWRQLNELLFTTVAHFKAWLSAKYAAEWRSVHAPRFVEKGQKRQEGMPPAPAPAPRNTAPPPAPPSAPTQASGFGSAFGNVYGSPNGSEGADDSQMF